MIIIIHNVIISTVIIEKLDGGGEREELICLFIYKNSDQDGGDLHIVINIVGETPMRINCHFVVCIFRSPRSAKQIPVILQDGA